MPTPALAGEGANGSSDRKPNGRRSRVPSFASSMASHGRQCASAWLRPGAPAGARALVACGRRFSVASCAVAIAAGSVVKIDARAINARAYACAAHKDRGEDNSVKLFDVAPGLDAGAGLTPLHRTRTRHAQVRPAPANVDTAYRTKMDASKPASADDHSGMNLV